MYLSQIQPLLFVRIAARPFCRVGQFEKVDNAKFLSGLYIASHNLYQKYNTAINVVTEARLPYSLTRYYVRIATRPTPFGFFAGCGVTDWNNPIQINTQHATYHTRLDHLVLHQIAQQLLSTPTIQAQLRYFPNNSLYPLHDEFRYVEYTLAEYKRDYKLSAVAASESLASIMQHGRSGARLSDLVEHVVSTYEVDWEEAEAYVQELVDSQLLVSELEPAITGEEYLPRLIR